MRRKPTASPSSCVRPESQLLPLVGRGCGAKRLIGEAVVGELRSELGFGCPQFGGSRFEVGLERCALREIVGAGGHARVLSGDDLDDAQTQPGLTGIVLTALVGPERCQRISRIAQVVAVIGEGPFDVFRASLQVRTIENGEAAGRSLPDRPVEGRDCFLQSSHFRRQPRLLCGLAGLFRRRLSRILTRKRVVGFAFAGAKGQGQGDCKHSDRFAHQTGLSGDHKGESVPILP